MDLANYTKNFPDLAVALVNTWDPPSSKEHLPDPRALDEWLSEHGIEAPPATTKDLEAARAVRSRLRAVFEAGTEEEGLAILNELLAEAPLVPKVVRSAGECGFELTARDAPIARRLASEGAFGLAAAIAEGGFDRLRICGGHKCLDVFVDVSRNRSRKFCSPHVCGNRASVAAYRARQKAEPKGA